MYMESQVALECEGLFTPGNPLIEGDSGVTSSSPSLVNSQQPAKKQTRQWAAWTRQEEESFFNALRQVGKNFEKITCRVQSKNKDQVRHYYYRLVRRMNKLLGPEFSLDAKNSKDTNAAMLRWWSLLEKYSCRASKLHLKPRRFKIFIEALEHQLLKDRKKNIRKRPSQGENCSSASPANVSLHSKASGHDARPVKLVIVDGQNIQKVGSGKGSSLKRNVNSGTNRSNSKGDLAVVKTVRQRRKTGGASSAAYKRWEKDAMAGVSLVADAAEHLERSTTDKGVSPDQGTSSKLFPRTLVPSTGQKGVNTFGKVMPHMPLPTSSQHQVTETSIRSSMKLKLQLFPIDEATRRALEKDEHNPHLELTLSDRKKISSVLEHLDRKWGNSSIARGELMLFPYGFQRENLVGCQRWKQDTVASAADVYAIIGSPPVFRLRYGWFSNAELVSVTAQAPATSLHSHQERMSVNIWNRKEQNADATPMSALPTGHDSEIASSKDQLTSMTQHTNLVPYTNLPEDMEGYINLDPKNNFPDSSEHAADLSWSRKETSDGIYKKQWEDADNMRMNSGATLSAGDWADSLTNISMGELLIEASQAMDTDGVEPPSIAENSRFLQQIPFSCDSFDAAIAAHISGRQGKLDLPSAQVSHASSIWDAEETCDAFSFRKISASDEKIPCLSGSVSLETWKQAEPTCSMGFRGLVEVLSDVRTTDYPVCEGDPIDNSKSDTNRPDDSTKDLGVLTDIYWPDSLGPLDLDIPSTRYHGQDLMFSDSISLSGLNRLIANSLDAFQNCSFFGLDKKEPSSTSEATRGTNLLSDHKIGGEV